MNLIKHKANQHTLCCSFDAKELTISQIAWMQKVKKQRIKRNENKNIYKSTLKIEN